MPDVLPRAASTTWVVGAVLLTACGLTNCSLTAVADFDLPQCKDDAECRAAFNAQNGFYPECAAFTCETRGKRRECVPVPEEVFDGKDNDCDRLIDEAEESIIETQQRTVVQGVSERPVRINVASSDSFGEAIYYAKADAGFVVPLGNESTEPTMTRLLTQTLPGNDGSYGISELKELTPGCYRPAPPVSSCDLESTEGMNACLMQSNTITNCNFGDLAVAAGEHHAFFASLNLEGCTSGELRAGLIEPTQRSDLIARGREARDPSFRGVATRGSACSDNGTPACRAAKAGEGGASIASACGVSKPRIAAGGEQALTVFLGLSAAATDCKPKVPILGLALSAESATFGEEYFWTNPSHDGEPDLIGTTNGGSGAAIAALDELGYLIVFGNAQDELEIAFLPRQARASTVVDPAKLREFPEYEQRDDYSTEPLRGLTTLARLPTGSFIDGVNIAWLETREDTVAVGISWIDDCTRLGAPANAFFQQIDLDVRSEIPTLSYQAERVKLGSSALPPLVVASQCPFVVQGYSRSGREAKANDDGGFYVLTAPRDERARAVRIASFDGQPVDSSETLWPLPEQSIYVAAGEPGSFLSYSENQALILNTFLCDD